MILYRISRVKRDDSFSESDVFQLDS